MNIEEFQGACSEEILRFSIGAWEPVFASIRATLGDELFQEFYGDSWVEAQRSAISAAFSEEHVKVWVGRVATKTVGFVLVKTHEADSMGEIFMIAVDPDYQKEKIGKQLSNHALAWMKSSGLKLAMVETGSDPGHLAARATYESVGFTAWPAVRYFKKL